MKIVGARRLGSKVIGRVQEVSRLAKARLKWMDHYGTHRNATLTCRYFGISRQTFYRRKGRYNPRDLSSMEERSHKPKRLRQPTWSRELALAILHLREQYDRCPIEQSEQYFVTLKRLGKEVEFVGSQDAPICSSATAIPG